MRSRIQSILYRLAPVILLVAVLALWEASCRIFEIPNYLLPSPSEIFTAGIQVSGKTWYVNVWATLQVVVLGFGISFLVSLPLAIAVVNSPILSRTLMPVLVIVQSTPVVAIAPIVVVTLGAGVLPRVLITCLITFFPLVVSTIAGMRATPADLIELSRSLRAPRLRQFLQIRIPYAVPYILSASKVSITLAVIGSVVAEFVASNNGLGYMIQYATSQFKLSQAFAALFLLLCISLSLYQIVVVIERVFFKWSIPK